MKKNVTVLLCAFLAFSLLLCGCGNGKDETQDGDQADNTLRADLYDNDIAQIELIYSDSFYFSGSLTDESGETTQMEMALKDGNSYMGANMQGITVGFMKVGTDYYMVYPDGECALALDEEVCAEMDIDPTEMSLESNSLDFGVLNDELLISTDDAMVDTKKATCRTYMQDSGALVKTYISDGYLIRVQLEDAQGTVLRVYNFDILTDVVPEDKVSLPSGYKLYSGTVGMMSFMMKFAAAVGFDNIE